MGKRKCALRRWKCTGKLKSGNIWELLFLKKLIFEPFLVTKTNRWVYKTFSELLEDFCPQLCSIAFRANILQNGKMKFSKKLIKSFSTEETCIDVFNISFTVLSLIIPHRMHPSWNISFNKRKCGRLNVKFSVDLLRPQIFFHIRLEVNFNRVI